MQHATDGAPVVFANIPRDNERMRTALSISFLVCLAADAAAEQIRYVLTPQPAAGRLKVELNWDTKGRKQSSLAFLEHWGSVNNIASLSKNVAFKGVQARQDGRRWRIDHGQNKTIECTYEIECDQNIEWDRTFYPVITNDYFHGIGAVFLLAPELPKTGPQELDVLVRWNLPPEWKNAVCSLGEGKHVGASISVSDLQHSVYLAGDIVTHTDTVLERSVTVAIRDRFGFNIDEFADMAAKIARQQREFMADDQFPPFLVTAIPVGDAMPEGSSSQQGTGLYNSFAAFMAPKAKINDAMEHLFAHELFHHWNGRILDRDPPEELVYWFSEGFTDYYALRILYESKQWDAKTYCKWINRHLAEYARNPARNAGNDEIKSGFWSQRKTVGEVAYQRGLLLALRWNKMAKDHSVLDGVDKLFKGLVNRAIKTGFKLSNDKIRAAGVELLGGWFGPEFDHFVVRAETVDVSADALAPDFKAEKQTVYEYALGFDDKKSFAERHVRGLVIGSPAEKAGLREGDELAGWSVFGTPDRKTELRVKRDNKVTKIEYFPRGRGIEVLQFKPDK